MHKGRSLVVLLSQFRHKLCEAHQDKISSLLALCGEGSDLRVDYSASRQELAMQVLYSCKKSFCLCTFALVVRHVLGLRCGYNSVHLSSSQEFLTTFHNSAPFIKWVVPGPAVHKDNAEANQCSVYLRDHCATHDALIDLYSYSHDWTDISLEFFRNEEPRWVSHDDPDYIHVRYTTGKRRNWNGYVSSISADRMEIMLHVTFEALLSLVGFFDDRCIEQHGLCPRVLSVGTLAEKEHGGSTSSLSFVAEDFLNPMSRF